MDNNAACLFFNVTMSNIKLSVSTLFAEMELEKFKAKSIKILLDVMVIWVDIFFG